MEQKKSTEKKKFDKKRLTKSISLSEVIDSNRTKLISKFSNLENNNFKFIKSLQKINKNKISTIQNNNPKRGLKNCDSISYLKSTKRTTKLTINNNYRCSMGREIRLSGKLTMKECGPENDPRL